MIIDFALWTLATTLLVIIASNIAKRFDPTAGSFTIVHTVVIIWTWITITASILSIFSCLLNSYLLTSTLLFASATKFVIDIKTRKNGRCTSSENLLDPNWLTTGWISLLCFWTGHIMTSSLTRFETDYDTLMYHLPLINYWIQAHSLYAPASGHWSNPGGNELLGLWATINFDNDSLVVLSNIPAILLLAFGTLELGQLLGLVPTLRYATLLAVIGNFVVLKQINDVENDVSVAGLFLVVLCYGYRAQKSSWTFNCIMGSLATGLLCGVKYYALGLAAVAWAFSVMLSCSKNGVRAAFSTACCLASGAFFTGGFWYIRNTIITGSPFYPLVFAKASVPLVTDYPSPWQTTFLGNGNPEVWRLSIIAVWNMSGPCQILSIFFLPAVFLWFCFGNFSALSISKSNSVHRISIAFALLGSAIILWITPMALEDVPGTLNHLRWSYTPVRYGLGFLSLATISLVLASQDLLFLIVSANWSCGHRIFRTVYDPTTYLAFSVGLLAAYQVADLSPGAEVDWRNSLFVSFGAWTTSYLICKYVKNFSCKVKAIIHLVFVSISFIFFYNIHESWNKNFVKFYETYYRTKAIDKIASLSPKPVCVAYYDYQCYAFFGPQRQTRLCQSRPVYSYSYFVEYLLRWKVSHVVVRTDAVGGWDNFSSIKGWMVQHNDNFKLIFKDNSYSIYQFNHIH